MGVHDSIHKAVNWNAAAVAQEESLREAIRKMASNNSSALVVKQGDVVIGVITDMDMMHRVEAGVDLDRTLVSHCMTACDLIDARGAKSPCVQLASDRTVAEALGVMTAAGVHNLLVSGSTDNDAGIVSLRELLRLAVD